MTVPRIFTSKESIDNDSINVTDDACRKVNYVLRSRKGDRINFFDGLGMEYETVAESFSKDKCLCRITKKIKHSEDDNTKIILFLGILKKEKMDYAIEKSSQLGVSVIVPLKSERSQVKLNDSKIQEKQPRWEKIAIEGCALSRRVFIPEIKMPSSISDALKYAENSALKILFWEKETSHIKNLFEGKQLTGRKSSIAAAIGPEGGFTDEEIKEFEMSGFLSASLGKNILSADTAVATALSIIQYEIGGFK